MKAEHISREVFDCWIDRKLKQTTTSHLQYTYIAKSIKGDIYKFGMSRDPMRREKELHGVYKGFKIIYFIEANIELALHISIGLAGGKNAFRNKDYSGPREAFFLNDDDVDYIVRHCGFRPIKDFNKPYFDVLFHEECEDYFHSIIDHQPNL